MVKGYVVDLEEFCDYCPEFEPECRQDDCTAIQDKEQRVINNITCSNVRKCKWLIERQQNRNK